MSHVFRSKCPIFDLEIQNGYRQHRNKSDFYACELKYHKQHMFNGNLDIDYLIRQIRLQGMRNCV